jgi:hypothetical protein
MPSQLTCAPKRDERRRIPFGAASSSSRVGPRSHRRPCAPRCAPPPALVAPSVYWSPGCDQGQRSHTKTNRTPVKLRKRAARRVACCCDTISPRPPLPLRRHPPPPPPCPNASSSSSATLAPIASAEGLLDLRVPGRSRVLAGTSGYLPGTAESTESTIGIGRDLRAIRDFRRRPPWCRVACGYKRAPRGRRAAPILNDRSNESGGPLPVGTD